jgi:hypothetical protein
VGALKVDFPDLIELYLCSWVCTSSLVLLGGKGGSAAGLNSGARTAYLSDLEVIEVPFDMADTDERVVAIELTESLDAFLLSVISEGLRGGSVGDVMDGVGGGNLGPRELCKLCVEVLGGRLGRDTPSIPFAKAASGRKLSGWLPILALFT